MASGARSRAHAEPPVARSTHSSVGPAGDHTQALPRKITPTAKTHQPSSQATLTIRLRAVRVTVGFDSHHPTWDVKLRATRRTIHEVTGLARRSSGFSAGPGSRARVKM